MLIEELKEREFKRREEQLKSAKKQELIYSNISKKSLHITYVMTWTAVCGGTKIILEHANKLTQRGHKVTLISHDKKPIWFPMDNQIEFIEVPWGEILCKRIPRCDLIIATYWREIYECVEQKIAPVIYFEQGDIHLFDLDKLENRTFNYIKKQLQTIQFIYTVSNFAKEKLQSIYQVNSIVIPNAVNEEVFFYKTHKQNIKPTITIIGAEEAEFKRTSNILKAIKILQDKGYQIELNWITPTNPNECYGNTIINPKQIKIGDTLRNTDIYICASIYEAFCLPVLEAMTCGAAVITTNNGGNMDFVEDGKNALIIEKDNIEDIVEKVQMLLDNSKLKNMISSNAVKTSKNFSWNRTINQIISYYTEVSKYQVK